MVEGSTFVLPRKCGGEYGDRAEPLARPVPLQGEEEGERGAPRIPGEHFHQQNQEEQMYFISAYKLDLNLYSTFCISECG